MFEWLRAGCGSRCWRRHGHRLGSGGGFVVCQHDFFARVQALGGGHLQRGDVVFVRNGELRVHTHRARLLVKEHGQPNDGSGHEQRRAQQAMASATADGIQRLGRRLRSSTAEPFY